ncbi:PspA/IM30 family protein [Bacillaceae bacterium S4-13-58]
MFKKFNRIKTIVKSEINAILDKAEDPVKMLDQFIREMELEIQDAESAIAKQIANERMLVRKYDDAQVLVVKRQIQAEKALEADDEELSRCKLKDKKYYQEQAEILRETWDRAHTDSMLLKDKLHYTKIEYYKMKLKRDSLKVRAESAKVKTKMNHSMSSFSRDKYKGGFERMKEKVLRYEAEAGISEDVSKHNRSLKDEFESLERNSIDDGFWK